MRDDTERNAERAADELERLAVKLGRDTTYLLKKKNIPEVVAYYEQARATVKALQERLDELQNHINQLNHVLIPALFESQKIKTINVEGVGRVTINDRWFGSILKGRKEAGFDWLRSSGNEGLIIETVNSQTLGAFAHEELKAKRPLPDDIFNIYAQPSVSIT